MSLNIYQSLKIQLDQGEKAAVITFIDTAVGFGETSHYKLLRTEKQLCSQDQNRCLDEAAAEKAITALKTGNVEYFKDSNGVTILIEPYFPKPRLIVLGGGQITKPLVELGAKVGFLTTVVDHRPQFAGNDQFPEAEKVICENFSNCLNQINLNEYSYVVIFTREHQHDLECLKQLLNHKTAYVGMIGSKTSVEHVKEQLRREGYSQEQIDLINAPIGLEIGATTSEEIAVSIVAQLIQFRRLCGIGKDEAGACPVNWPELDQAVLEELCKETGDSKAMITIIDTKGSTPGKTGTKMLVWSYGMVVGSVGGGYAEGEVINIAWQVIGSGGLTIQEIDMTGQFAKEEGMVCGGIMTVLVEDYEL